ncbi:MAG: apolipoprotein N-acyltransferase, partial [Hydrogenothermus sp.]
HIKVAIDKPLCLRRLVFCPGEKSYPCKYGKILLKIMNGEYTPFPFIIFSKIFPYLQGYDFSPGQKTNLLKHKGLSIATLICFEAIFPNFVANFAKNANLIVNVSNDAWFGKTSAPFQHLEMARVRAVETGRYLIRATNTGFSAIIAPNGKFEKVSELFKKQILIGEVFTSKENTFWVSYKNFVIVLFLLSFFALIFILEKRKKRPLPPQIFKNS